MSAKRKRTPAATVLLWVLLIGYLLLLYRVILFKFPIDTIFDILMDRDELEFTRVNLIPFQTIRFYLFSGRVPLVTAVRNLLGNILAFVPLGILIPLIRRDLSIVFTFVTALALSASIEITQLVTGLGSCDIDDIILNVFGAMLFCLLLISAEFLLPLLKRLGNLLLELIRMLLRPLFGYPMRPKSTKKRADARKNCAKKSAPKEQNSLDKPRRMR